MPRWKWVELKVALDKFIISNKDIISYALFILSDGMEQFDRVLNLSIAEEYEVKEILYELIINEKEQNIEAINSKWIFVIIYDAFMHSRDNVYDVIDDVYSEFEYPEEISNLIAYMPNNDGKTMDVRLVTYIESGKKIWC